MTKKINLKNCLTDDTLDLSMNDLQEVPVKDIAAIPKATTLDLSNNKLKSLGKQFPQSLTHLVKLDLSSNQLTSLPDNFGLLVSLKHLDLFKNRITMVPLSFGALRSLRWLDLKDNPLSPRLAQIAGPCLNSQQCQQAAKNVVNFLQVYYQQMEEQKEKELQLKKLNEEREKLQAKTQVAQQSKKKKKKNKGGDNAKEPNENGKPKSEPSGNENEGIEEQILDSKTLQTKQRSIIGSLISGLFKLTLFVVLVSLLIVFIISLLDEPTYRLISQKFSQNVKTLTAQLPKGFVEGWNRWVEWTTRSSKKLASNTAVAFQSVVLRLYNTYVQLSTNERVLMYAETFKDYWHCGYIKVTELVNQLFVNSTLIPKTINK